MAVDLAGLVTVEGGQVPVGPLDDLAVRSRAWYLEAMSHPLWVDYIKESDEDLGFYLGGEGQWSKDGKKADLLRLRAQNRTIVSINHCQAIVDVLAGFERQNRFDIRAVPQGDEDDHSAQLLTWLLKFVQDQTESQDHISEGFMDGVIRGMSCLELGVDRTRNPRGEIVVGKLTPGKDCIWDPYWQDYGFRDLRYFIRYKWGYVPDLIAEYSEHADAIRLATAQIDVFRLAETSTTSGPPQDAYGGLTSYAAHATEMLGPDRFFYDPEEQRALVLEVWYRDYRTVWQIMDAITGRVSEVEDGVAARAIAAADPEHITIAKRMIREVKNAVILPATYQVLDEDFERYDNDRENYPFIPFVAKRFGDTIFGVIRALKDPQRIENKRISQALDILAKFANIRPMVFENTLRDPNALNDPNDQSVIWLNPGVEEKKLPGWYIPPIGEVARILTEMATQLKMAIREISGINTDLLGIKADDASGIAIARRQAQGQTIATIYFDNLRRTRKLFGQRLARRIQQVFTTEQVVRLTNDRTGAPMLVRLNPLEAKRMNKQELAEANKLAADAGKPQILRDVSALKYDIIISDAPTTPSARSTALMALLDVVQKIPQIGPAVVDVIVELADIPHRQEILDRVHRMIPPALRGEQEPPTAGGAVAPPGVPTPNGPPAAGGNPMPGTLGSPAPAIAAHGAPNHVPAAVMPRAA